MTSITCVMAWDVGVLMVPLMLFIWALENKKKSYVPSCSLSARMK